MAFYKNDRSFEKGGSGFSRPLTQEGLKNFIGVGPKGYKRPDNSIYEEVCEILTANPDLDASEVEVLVSEGTVTLRGNVDSKKSKYLAEDIVLSLSGVSNVHNELHVTPYNFENMFRGMEDSRPHEKGLIQNITGLN